jgi:signal transduction histidine kinase
MSVLTHFETRAERTFFVALLLALLGLCIATVGSAATRVGGTWPGFVVWPNLVAPAIGGPDWPGVRAGIPQRAIVAAIDGTAIHHARELQAAIDAAPIGSTHRYTFRRGRMTSDVEVESGRLRWRNVLPVYLPYWIDGCAFFAVGLAVFYFRPRLAAARAALALGTILGTVLLLASDVFSASWLDVPYFVCESLTPAALLHLSLCFPEPKALLRRQHWLAWAVYLPFLPLALIQILAHETDPDLHLAVNDWVYAAIAAAGLVSIGSLVHTFLTSRSALARQQAKIVMAGVVCAAFLPSLGILSIIVFGAEVPMNLLAPFFIVYPLSIGYAIARHDLFAVDRYLRTGVVYAALSLVVFATYAAVVVGGESWLGAGRRLPSVIVPLYLLIVLVVFDPLRAAIQNGVDRLFYRQAYSYRSTVEATSRVLASVLDGERVAATVLDTLTDVMAIEWALLAIEDPDGTLRCFARPGEKAAEAHAVLGDAAPAALVTAALRTRRSRWVERGRRAAEGADGLGPLGRLGASVVLPMRFESAAVGVLALGEKRSGAFYTDEDLQLLETLVNQCALAFTNARAYEIIRRTQAELVEAERLAAVGELASTVAHGIRNPLAGIRAAAQVAREDVEPGSPVGESLDDIIAESDRLEMRVRSILDLSRPGASDSTAGDVEDVLRGLVAAVKPRVPPQVRLVLDVADDLPAVRFDPQQVTEALEILVVNALDALQGRAHGEIEVRARVDRDGDRTRPLVAISVHDDGPGIDAARLQRVFELFYTTKPTGTGVGLAMAKRLVERQGGTIDAASAVGEGATFTIRLPVAGSAAHAPAALVREA